MSVGGTLRKLMRPTEICGKLECMASYMRRAMIDITPSDRSLRYRVSRWIFGTRPRLMLRQTPIRRSTPLARFMSQQTTPPCSPA